MHEKRLTIPGQAREYAVSVGSGLFQNASVLLGTDVYSKVFVVTDEQVERLWLGKLRAGLPHVDGMISLPVGERA